MIYFDHAAASMLLPQLREKMPSVYAEFSGNPEAAHSGGYALRKALQNISDQLFKQLLPSAPPEKRAVFFAADATMLLNTVGELLAERKSASWGSALDHAAARSVHKRCFREYGSMQLSEYGVICNLPSAPENPGLITVNHVQSEIGVKQDLVRLLPELRSAAPEAVILVDAVQSSVFYAYPSAATVPDLLLISGEKLGAPGGAALLASGRHCQFFVEGFERLRKIEHRISKVCIPQAVLLAEAVKYNADQRIAALENIRQINQFLRNTLSNRTLPNGKKLRFTVPADKAADHILHLLLPGYQSGVLVRMFAAENILLSSGSACESESAEPSYMLTALGCSRSDAYSGLRLSFGKENTLAEAEVFCEKLFQILTDY